MERNQGLRYSKEQECTVEIMEYLGIAPKPLVENSTDAKSVSKHKSLEISSNSKMENDSTFSLSKTGDRQKDPLISAESEFGKDLISLMQGFNF
jgi:hypothetical protein